MSDIAITVENLSKSYWVGHQFADRESYTALRDVIAREAHNFARKTVDLFRGRQIVQGDAVEEFWALRDVSFEVKRGEVLGIIGRNGAGKSTVLKILSRITEPTRGRVILRGRVASLLEVGTGFHPELTGRENIFLNGAILGMRQREIRKKFDEIVSFAEVERFIDTPVKRYSSGMFVRLAFAVAAHLEPEILIIDEVLAVGDVEFQKKCLGKIGEVSKHGRTVLFVSHNMAAVQALCRSCICMKNGEVFAHSDTGSVINSYFGEHRTISAANLSKITGRQGSGSIRFHGLFFMNDELEITEFPAAGQDIFVVMVTSQLRPRSKYRASLEFSTRSGSKLFVCSTELVAQDTYTPPSDKTFICHIPRLPLAGGDYLVSLFLEENGQVCDYIDGLVPVQVLDRDFFGSGRNLPAGWSANVVLVQHDWPTNTPQTKYLLEAVKSHIERIPELSSATTCG